MTLDSGKSDLAFRTIGELATDLGVPQHILRYWETRFPQLKPLQRAGNRRYYRPDDVALARRIHRLLSQEGYTIRGVQQLLRRGDNGGGNGDGAATVTIADPPTQTFPGHQLRTLRKLLADALAEES